MTVRRVMPVLTVSDLDAAREAYVRIFGLREVMNHGWIVTLADDQLRHQVSLMKKDATAPVNPNVSIEVDDVDAAYRAAVDAGLQIVHPLSNEEWGVGYRRVTFGRVWQPTTTLRKFFVRRQIQAATIPEPLNLHGWMAIDELNRALAGTKDSGYILKIHLVTKDNISADGGPKNIFDPDNGYRDQYKKIWGVQ